MLTHPDNAIGIRITPACKRFDWTGIGLSALRMIDSPLSIFDPELKQHKFVEEGQEGNKNLISTKGSVHQICTKSKA